MYDDNAFEYSSHEEWLEAYEASEVYMKGMDHLSVNVNRGEIFLDSVDPGWYKKVNLSGLDMSSGAQCVCGWVFKDMVEELCGFNYFEDRYEHVDSVDHGFMYDGALDIGSSYQWSMLAELWTLKVEKRLANDGLLA